LLPAPLWPEVLPELEPLAAGVEVLLWPEVAPELEPLAASFMHFSFSAPIRCAHFVSLAPAAALPLAPVLVEVLDWPLVAPLPDVLELGLSAEVLLWPLVLAPAPADPLDDVDGVLCALVELEGLEVCALVLALPPVAAEPLAAPDGLVCALVEVDGVLLLCELVLPLAAPRSRRQRSFSAPNMLSQLLAAMPPAAVPGAPLCAPVLLPDDEDVCAKEALDSARSAAAVALARILRFICWLLLGRLAGKCSAGHASTMPVTSAWLRRRNQCRAQRYRPRRPARWRGRRRPADARRSGSARAPRPSSARRHPRRRAA
jgi:hypothetical protein